MHGALVEAQHVYLDAGTLWYLASQSTSLVRILEIGLGTGLNAVLTLAAVQKDTLCHYVALEPFPISVACADAYSETLASIYPQLPVDLLAALHRAPENTEITLKGHRFCKHTATLENFITDMPFDVIYMDAFSPSTQPELWEPEILQKLATMLAPGGYLVTYCAKGSVRRGLAAAGLETERLPGPPGKREMLRARKPFLLSEGL